MARSRETKIELTAYDDLFQTDESREEAKLSKIRDIPISEIDEFPDHPFKVLMDEDMEQLVESIKRNGVMTPATVRLKEDGRYELISGHRRKKACELAGLETLKCEVKELTRDEAIIVMVESNLQRSVILPSEKAFAYKMRLEAMKRQAGRPQKENASPLATNLSKGRSDEELGELVGESKDQIRRYIRLTELVPEILQMVDERQIAFRPAVEVSYLTEEQQYTLLEAMEYNDATPSLAQAATAFAAGDIGTISFSHTYDSNGNAMRYNSSANIGGYTAGGTGNYKYRMFVDGENAFCIQPGVPLKTGNTLKKASSDTWNALSANQKKAVGLALLYGYQGNRNNLSGSDDEKWLATQTLVWEFVTGCREATGSYNQTSTTVYSLHFGSNYANSGARAVYDQIVAMLREHNTIPSFMSGGKNDITKELAYKDGKYSITLTDSNGVLSDYSFSSSDSNVSVSKSGNKLTISSTVAISGSVRITAKRHYHY